GARGPAHGRRDAPAVHRAGGAAPQEYGAGRDRRGLPEAPGYVQGGGGGREESIAEGVARVLPHGGERGGGGGREVAGGVGGGGDSAGGEPDGSGGMGRGSGGAGGDGARGRGAGDYARREALSAVPSDAGDGGGGWGGRGGSKGQICCGLPGGDGGDRQGVL